MDATVRSPYQAPEGPIEDSAGRKRKPFFLAPPAHKLAVMIVATLGLYLIWWFYRNWRAVQRHEGRRRAPVWRAMFSFLFAHGLFKAINRIVAGHDATARLKINAGGLAIAYAVLYLCAWLPPPYWLVFVSCLFPLLPVNALARRYNEAIDGDLHRAEDAFNMWNWLGIALDGLFWLLILLGMVLTAIAAWLPAQDVSL